MPGIEVVSKAVWWEIGRGQRIKEEKDWLLKG